MKLKTERDLSYIDPLTAEFFQNNGTSSIGVILLTYGRMDGQTIANLNTSLAKVKNVVCVTKRSMIVEFYARPVQYSLKVQV